MPLQLWTLLAINDAITNGSVKWDPAGSTEGYKQNTLIEPSFHTHTHPSESRPTPPKTPSERTQLSTMAPSTRKTAKAIGKTNHQMTA